MREEGAKIYIHQNRKEADTLREWGPLKIVSKFGTEIIDDAVPKGLKRKQKREQLK